MPRVPITVNTLPKNGGLESITWTPADATNQHYYSDAGSVILLARNGDASTKTVTLVSVAEPEFGRTGDKAFVVPAAVGGKSGVIPIGLVSPQGFRQTGTTNVNVNVSASTNLDLAAISITAR
jgi:hypothetical protein